MKKNIALTALLCTFLLVMTGCSNTENSSSSSAPASEGSSSVSSSVAAPEPVKPLFPTDEEILTEVTPYLANAEQQDVSTDDTLKANMGFGSEVFTNPVLYMGMPKGNTTYFFMADLTETADKTIVKEKLDTILQGWVKTSEQGYVVGGTDYSIIEKGNKIFAVMHEESNSFQKLTAYLNGLEG